MVEKMVSIDPEEREFEVLLALAGDLSGKRVLEIGCGNGRITRHLAQFAAHITAIDPDEDRIPRYRANAPALAGQNQLSAIPLAELPPGERFDLALLSWSL